MGHTRKANFRVVEVSPATWSIRPVSLDEPPGHHPDGLIVQVVNLPDDLPSRTITDRLTRVVDLATLPATIDWSDWPSV